MASMVIIARSSTNSSPSRIVTSNGITRIIIKVISKWTAANGIYFFMSTTKSVRKTKNQNTPIILMKSNDFKRLLKNPIVIDGRRSYNPEELIKNGITYRGIGWKNLNNQVTKLTSINP